MTYDVPLVAQTTNMSCWAASIAMILGWRDQACYSDVNIAANYGGTSYTPSMTNGLDPNDKYILRRNGFAVEWPRCYTPQGFLGLLDDHGPLWVASKPPGGGPHIRVVTGYQGSQLYVNDPAPVNRGARYTRSFADFMNDSETLGAEELHEPSPVYVAYLTSAAL